MEVDEDIVVLGGGPAGAATACDLAERGFSPLLIERDTGPRHKICGEFLSIEAQAYLRRLGVDPEALGGAPIHTLRLLDGGAMVETPLPFGGVGLTRRTLDEVLLDQAGRKGARIWRGGVARSAVPAGRHLDVHLRGGDRVRARTVFLATGKHDLHEPRRPAGRSGGDLIGFKTYFALDPRRRAELDGAVEIHLFDGGYAGLQRVENGMANLCLLVRRERFDEVGRRWENLLGRLCANGPHLRRRLEGATALLGRPLSISRVPYGFVHDSGEAEPQALFRLGDQMGVIPSFSGDGIAIALHSAHLAASVYAERGNAASDFHRRLRADIRHQIRLASFLYDFSRLRAGRRALVALTRLYPGMLGHLAAWTRLPEASRGGLP